METFGFGQMFGNKRYKNFTVPQESVIGDQVLSMRVFRGDDAFYIKNFKIRGLPMFLTCPQFLFNI